MWWLAAVASMSTTTTKGGKPSRNITAAEYRDVMLETLLPEGQRLMGPHTRGGWFFQQDNDPSHRGAGRLIEEYNSTNHTKVQILPKWPPNSPDLNLIENVWGMVQAEVDAKGCKTFAQFKAAVLEGLAHLTPATLNNLYSSMGSRLAKVVATGGDKCGY
jgi:hypothetical protein